MAQRPEGITWKSPERGEQPERQLELQRGVPEGPARIGIGNCAEGAAHVSLVLIVFMHSGLLLLLSLRERPHSGVSLGWGLASRLDIRQAIDRKAHMSPARPKICGFPAPRASKGGESASAFLGTRVRYAAAGNVAALLSW